MWLCAETGNDKETGYLRGRGNSFTNVSGTAGGPWNLTGCHGMTDRCALILDDRYSLKDEGRRQRERNQNIPPLNPSY
mgnify:CR=1 FL=1